VTKPNRNPDPIAAAEAVVRTEKEELARILTKRARIDADVLLYASAQRDQAARPTDFNDSHRRLAAIHTQLAALRADERELSVEISSASQRVAAAEAALRRLQSVEGAQKVRELLPELELHAKRLDEATRVLIDGYSGFKDLMREVRALSGSSETNAEGRPLDPSPAPSDRVVAVNMRNALVASLIETDLEVERLPPHARRSFGTLAAAWRLGIERWCDDCLPARTNKEAA
jgi:hypothetical protein